MAPAGLGERVGLQLAGGGWHVAWWGQGELLRLKRSRIGVL